MCLKGWCLWDWPLRTIVCFDQMGYDGCTGSAHLMILMQHVQAAWCYIDLWELTNVFQFKVDNRTWTHLNTFIYICSVSEQNHHFHQLRGLDFLLPCDCIIGVPFNFASFFCHRVGGTGTAGRTSADDNHQCPKLLLGGHVWQGLHQEGSEAWNVT